MLRVEVNGRLKVKLIWDFIPTFASWLDSARNQRV